MEELQTAFDQMKARMAIDVLCAYPNHDKLFHIYTHKSDYQLGSCIMQEGQPVAYYTKKLNNAQCNYSTVDKEALYRQKKKSEFELSRPVSGQKTPNCQHKV